MLGLLYPHPHKKNHTYPNHFKRKKIESKSHNFVEVCKIMIKESNNPLECNGYMSLLVELNERWKKRGESVPITNAKQ